MLLKLFEITNVTWFSDLEEYFVNGVIIVELDESESFLFAGVFVGEPCHLSHGPELGEVAPDLVILNVLLEAAQKQLLDGRTGLGLMSELFTWGSPFGFNLKTRKILLKLYFLFCTP